MGMGEEPKRFMMIDDGANINTLEPSLVPASAILSGLPECIVFSVGQIITINGKTLRVASITHRGIVLSFVEQEALLSEEDAKT